ncbi:MAG: SpoVA/SpoVAEb family sporulation membrane protein [Clostridia bacterium]|nr:SpoVA/SpoVAEb family sporulation membrane protein [Clostridia bacterium]
MRFVWAFVIGGALCIPAQILIDKTKLMNSRILTGYVVAGVLLGGIGVYNAFADFAGSGAGVPLLGFGNALANGVKEAIDRDGAIGILTGGLTGTSAGITAAVVLSVLWSLIFKSRQK